MTAPMEIRITTVQGAAASAKPVTWVWKVESTKKRGEASRAEAEDKLRLAPEFQVFRSEMSRRKVFGRSVERAKESTERDPNLSDRGRLAQLAKQDEAASIGLRVLDERVAVALEKLAGDTHAPYRYRAALDQGPRIQALQGLVQAAPVDDVLDLLFALALGDDRDVAVLPFLLPLARQREAAEEFADGPFIVAGVGASTRPVPVAEALTLLEQASLSPDEVYAVVVREFAETITRETQWLSEMMRQHRGWDDVMLTGIPTLHRLSEEPSE